MITSFDSELKYQVGSSNLKKSIIFGLEVPEGNNHYIQVGGKKKQCLLKKGIIFDDSFAHKWVNNENTRLKYLRIDVI